MIHNLSAFRTDEVILTRWDLLKLFFGKKLKGTGLVVYVKSNRTDISSIDFSHQL